MVAENVPTRSGFRPKCPVCDNLVSDLKSPQLPFCSDRCRLIDLGRWLDEQHAVPCDRRDEEDVPVEQIGEEPRPPVRLPPGWHDA